MFFFSSAIDGTQKNEVSLQLIKATDHEARYVFAHSAAHILGLSLERVYGEHLMLADGPPINNGIIIIIISDRKSIGSFTHWANMAVICVFLLSLP